MSDIPQNNIDAAARTMAYFEKALKIVKDAEKDAEGMGEHKDYMLAGYLDEDRNRLISSIAELVMDIKIAKIAGQALCCGPDTNRLACIFDMDDALAVTGIKK
jgi:hypothetical protein